MKPWKQSTYSYLTWRIWDSHNHPHRSKHTFTHSRASENISLRKIIKSNGNVILLGKVIGGICFGDKEAIIA